MISRPKFFILQSYTLFHYDSESAIRVKEYFFPYVLNVNKSQQYMHELNTLVLFCFFHG